MSFFKPAAARILIVDDTIANIALLTSMLGRIGYNELCSINDSRRTLEKVEAFKPDLIILDLMMPHLDGFEVMRQLEGVLAPDSYLPVLVLTADSSATTKRKALASGATDFLHKPFDASEIFIRIRNLLQTRFLHLATRDQNRHLEEKVAERTQALSQALEELKHTQRALLQQERLRAFGEMAGGVVHDFNNALMSVIGYSELILQDPNLLDDKPTVLECLKTMNTAGRDAAHVVSRLRDFYRPREAADVFEPVDLNKIIEETVALTQPKWRDQAMAEGKTVQMQLELEKVPPISGKPAELREILTNLVFNAVDAMPEGGTITLRTRASGERVSFESIDTGIGMNEEVRARCLEPFFSTKGEKGTGLGLSTVIGVIKRHEGELEIESELNRGTTFRVHFPSQVKTFYGEANDEALSGRSFRVLVVDDDPIPRDVVSRYLHADGHQVVEAAGAAEALESLAEEKFDLVVTDNAMPQMNGTQLAQLIKAERADQPVLMLTGYSDPTLAPNAPTPGVDLMLPKPISHSELRCAISQLLPA